MNSVPRVKAPSLEGLWDLPDIVEAIAEANADVLKGATAYRGRHKLPSKESLEGIIANLRMALFPVHYGDAHCAEPHLRAFVGHRLDAALFELQEQIGRGLIFAATNGAGDCVEASIHARERTYEFARRLPEIRRLLGRDARAAFDGDPAATSTDEAIFCYPGFTAMIHHRIAHALHVMSVPLIPRMISELAHTVTGIDIHPGASIGGSLFIDHGTGVVIGETAIIGERVRLYQGVTLGAKNFPTDDHGRSIKGLPRHPILEDDVTIYAGATILGRITIGRGSSIGGNVWLTRGVPPGSFISQAQVRSDLFDGGSGI